jgi:hypothetical protein
MPMLPSEAGWLKLRGRDIEDLESQRADRHLDPNLLPPSASEHGFSHWRFVRDSEHRGIGLDRADYLVLHSFIRLERAQPNSGAQSDDAVGATGSVNEPCARQSTLQEANTLFDARLFILGIQVVAISRQVAIGLDCVPQTRSNRIAVNRDKTLEFLLESRETFGCEEQFIHRISPSLPRSSDDSLGRRDTRRPKVSSLCLFARGEPIRARAHFS